MGKLTTTEHDRDADGLRYVYSVVSRRAGGVSVGVNLNPNNACNWRCVYCQVPGLTRGTAPEIDLSRLDAELRELLLRVQSEHWLAEHTQPEHRRLVDVAFSGNGEPTTARPFDEIIERVMATLDEVAPSSLSRVLITNGSMMGRDEVQRGVARLGDAGGEVWFKIDRIDAAARSLINGTNTSAESVRTRLRACAARCRTRIQTCVFALDGAPPDQATCDAYVSFLAQEVAADTPIADVLMYGLARESHQPEAPRLTRLPAAWLEAFADRVRAVGIAVVVHP